MEKFQCSVTSDMSIGRRTVRHVRRGVTCLYQVNMAECISRDGEIENSGKSIFEIRIQNFCYIQVIVFDLSYLPVAAVGTKQVRYHEKLWKTSFDIFLYFSQFFHCSGLATSQ